MILIYDQTLLFLGEMTPVCWSYAEPLNDLPTARITLAAQDDWAARILVPASWARLYDGARDLGFFRFSAIEDAAHGEDGEITYALQGAQCTLLDSLLAGWHELGGTGVSTRQVMAYILARQQEPLWTLGDCEFEAYFQYNFEDVNLLEALMSLGEVIVGDWQMIFDSTVTPWTVHLRRAPSEAAASLVYRRTMTQITRSVSGTVITRLHGRGYGEGDNQLTIASVNGGLDYIDAPAEVVARWGIREGMHVDKRQTDAATLKARMEALLALAQEPSVSYEADAIDLYQATGEPWDDVRVGDRVLVLDEVLGSPVRVRVTARQKEDVEGDPGSVRYVLDNARADTAEEINEILERVGVHDLYAQGATNMYSMQISDNADAAHPLTMRFYVPGNVLRINSCLIYWQLDAFRTYVTLAKSGGSTRETSESGGGATVSLPETIVSQSAATGSPQSGEGTAAEYTEQNTAALATGEAGLHTHSGGSHHHYMDGHVHNLNAHTHSVSGERTGTPSPSATTSGGSGYTGYSGTEITGQAGAHTHSVAAHTHKFDHWHHVTLSVTIPAMTFTLTPHTHTVSFPAHMHELEYGVYESTRAGSVALVVDGTSVPQAEIGDARELDVVPYLETDDEGRIRRSAWHEIAFVPDALTRITADLFFQVFIQSRGGGDY